MSSTAPDDVLREAETALEDGDRALDVARRYLHRASRNGRLEELRGLCNDYSPGAADGVFLDHLLRSGAAGGGPAADPGPGAGAAAPVVTLSDVEPEDVGWVWKPYIPVGKLVMVDGDPGTLKSTVNLDIGARLSRGAPMPDGTEPEVDGAAGTVLLTAEDGLADTVRPRFDAAGGDPSRVAVVQHVPDAEGEPRFPHIEDTPELARAVESVDAKMIIVDPLMAFLPPDVNSNNDQSVRRALAPLVELADDLGVAVVAIRHLNKGGGENPKYRGGGSIGILGAARSGLLIAEDPDAPETRRVLAVTKSNLAPKGPSLAFRAEQARNGRVRIKWEGQSDHTALDLLDTLQGEERTARQEAADILRVELRDGPRPVSELRDVADRLGVTWRTVRRAADAIDVEKNRVGGLGADGRWEWSLPTSPDDDPDGPPTFSQKRVPLGGAEGSDTASDRDVSYPDRGGVPLEDDDDPSGDGDALSGQGGVPLGDGPEGQGDSEGSPPYPDSETRQGPPGPRCACGNPRDPDDARCAECKARVAETYMAMPDPDRVEQFGDTHPHMTRRPA